jgi:phosphodiesterase/alkaline phosphatase D-like protein
MSSSGFSSRWSDQQDRLWLGPEYWANRLQDWHLKDGRLESVVERVTPMRTLYLLTTRLGEQEGTLDMSVRTGIVAANSKGTPAEAATGFLVGVGGGMMDYRAAAIVQWWPGKGAGLFAGISGDGKLFIRDNGIGNQPELATGSRDQGLLQDVVLKLTAHKAWRGYLLRLEAWDPVKLVLLDSAACKVGADRLVGTIALVCHPGIPRRTERNQHRSMNFWYQDWRVSGSKLTHHPQDSFGPIVCTQYTLSRGVMTMTAQLMPIPDADPMDVQLQVKSAETWRTVSTAALVVPGWTATFRVADWPGEQDIPYRVTWNGHSYAGTVRREPVDKDTIVVAGFTGNHNKSGAIGGRWDKGITRQNDWITGMWFPHADIVAHVVQQQPDVLFFSGDQVYESWSPTPADMQNIKLDYLYKWYLWCWAYRDLTKDIPTVTIPDDHDVYQSNLWGEGGRKSPGGETRGGYTHPADFVRMVERTQTSHLPEPYDSSVLAQGITSYYTSMIYGGIGFAILEDRKFKSGCSRPEMPPSGTDRPDYFNDPDFDISRLDVPGLKLLGDKQLEFLNAFAQDWTGQDMKIALSQTIFANLATHHGGKMERIRCDLDSNGWPQAGRNRAVDALRRGFMFHLAGDQHLGSLVHHGIAEHGDAMWSMCVPSIANFHPRAWAPRCDMPYEFPDPRDYLGEFNEGFGHPVTVYAVTNPGRDMGQKNKDLHNGMPGYGIVRMNKSTRTYTVECWPRFANPASGEQYPGWPRTIEQVQNYGRKAYGYLPPIDATIGADPVVQVVDEQTREILYTLRIKGTEFQPWVFTDGLYTVKVMDTANGKTVETNGLKPGPKRSY